MTDEELRELAAECVERHEKWLEGSKEDGPLWKAIEEQISRELVRRVGERGHSIRGMVRPGLESHHVLWVYGGTWGSLSDKYVEGYCKMMTEVIPEVYGIKATYDCADGDTGLDVYAHVESRADALILRLGWLLDEGVVGRIRNYSRKNNYNYVVWFPRGLP